MKNELKAKICKIAKEAVLPKQGSALAAGYDVCACCPDEPFGVNIRPHTTVMISTGLRIEPPEGYWVGVFARSGLASKEGLRPANCVGVIDNDYRGTYMVALHNDSESTRKVNHGDRIAQIVFLPMVTCDFIEVESPEAFTKTERDADGFGSTGK